MFLDDDSQKSLDDLSELYLRVNFRPAVTNINWRMDCAAFRPGAAAVEDYIYRLWVQQGGFAAAQNHGKSNYMRHPPGGGDLQEEVSNLLKRKIKASLSGLEDLSIAFDYEGEGTDTEQSYWVFNKTE